MNVLVFGLAPLDIFLGVSLVAFVIAPLVAKTQDLRPKTKIGKLEITLWIQFYVTCDIQFEC